MTLNIAGSTLNSHSLICPSIKVGRHTTRQSIPSWDVGFSVVNYLNLTGHCCHRRRRAQAQLLFSSSVAVDMPFQVSLVAWQQRPQPRGDLAVGAAAAAQLLCTPTAAPAALQNVTVVSQLSFSWGSLIDGDGDTRTDKGGCSLCWRSCGAAAPPPLIRTRSSTPPTSYSPAPPPHLLPH